MAQQQETVKDTQSDPLKRLEHIYFLSVKVSSAKDLEKADFVSQSSDPFCKVIANKQTWKTKEIMDNLAPEWNEETSFVFFTDVDEITFQVWDWDKGSKHDLIGVATLSVKEYYNKGSKGFTGSIPLKECKKGSINVCVTGRTVKPLELEQKVCDLEKTCKEQEDELKQKKSEYESLQAQTADLAKKKANYDDSKNKLTERCELLRGDIRKQKVSNSECQQQINDCNEQTKTWNSKCDEKKQEMQNKNEQIEKLKYEIKQEKQKKENYNKE
eukprot:149121_1